MAGNWQVHPPWTSEQGPTDDSLGSLIRDDFDIVNRSTELELITSFEWAGLSRQEVANLRNLTRSKELKDCLRPHNVGISSGIEVDMTSDEDPGNATFGLMISTKQEIPPLVISKIVDCIKHYRVH